MTVDIENLGLRIRRKLVSTLTQPQSPSRYLTSHIALAYHGLGEQDETFAWLERGFQQRDPKMTFLKVEPKWNNLRSDARFVDLMRRMNFE
jgi:hypothetical protein